MKIMKIEKDGIKVDIEMLGTFNIPDLDKEYIMYSIMDNDLDNPNGKVLLGELIVDGDNKKIVGINPEEKELVLAFYNEISIQLGGE